MPGSQPEAQIFNDIYSDFSNNIALLTVSLQLPPTKQEFVRSIVQEISSANRDPHVIFNQIGIKLGFVPEDIVKGAFVNLWLRDREADFNPLITQIRKEIAIFNGQQTAEGDIIPAGHH